ncbi:hypothetical protein AYJ54_23465 [Bradyrhizobium centrolobii]|uniref:Uncharacterized protein n=1 Tax=Bradyrhizobium centrolobii TaxID=1505087 RepID=A0A176YEJ1_9BRAD|nr:hypothetical protein AYJ54_23465 [Bradyrhizobium centrolobii]
MDSQSGATHVFERAADSGIELASKQTDFTVMLTIGCHSFIEPVVSARLQQGLQDLLEWRPDRALDIERFARIMSERTQCG